jgi:phosphatidylinositol glycan class Q protein
MRLIHATTSSNSEGSAILDCFLGILLAALILFHKESLRQTIGSTVIDIKQYLRTAILWLETFPVGFKLNVPLTQSMGRQILFVLDLWHEHVLQTILVGWRLEVLLQLLSLTSLCMGSTTLLAVTVDFLQLSTLHLTAIYIFFAYIYRCQLHMLDSLWKLFQGKKRNPLRRRTDTMHYDSMQLLVGMLTFSFVLFLFTTVLVYFLFFACAYIALQPVVLWFLYGLLRDLPIGNLWNRWRHPKLTGVGIYLEMQSPTTAWLRIIPRSYPSVLADFVRRYPHRLFSLVGKILLFLGSGKRLEIMADCIKPK